MTTNNRATNNRSKPVTNSRNSNAAGAIRDILVASLNKGQFPIAGVLLIFVIIFWRLPENELSIFLNNSFDRFENNYIIGWCLFVISLIGWYIHYRYVNKIHQKEMDRVTQEKERLQEQLFKRLK